MAKTVTIEKSLYKGAIDIVFYPNSHRYKLKGMKTYLVSVTAATGMINKPALIGWAVKLAGTHMKEYLENSKTNKFTKEELAPVIEEALKQHMIKKEKAATFGSMVHEFAEKFTNSVTEGTEAPEIDDTWPPEVLQGVIAFMDWYKEHKVKVEVAERMIYSLKNEFVGLCDAIGEVDGKRYLIDYKTSSGIYAEMKLQVAAYMMAYEEETGDKLEGAVIVKFGKEDGIFETETRSREDVEEDYKAFLGILAVKQRMKIIDKWVKK